LTRAEAIPHARFVEVPGNDHVPYIGDTEPITNAIQEFIVGVPYGFRPFALASVSQGWRITDPSRD
jgi:hypothetical protein